MTRRLFLTGPIGCGKSTAIQAALGEKLQNCGGFLTIRRRNRQGQPIDFVLMSPDGSVKEVFLDLSAPVPRLNPEAFSGLGVQLLTQAKAKPFVVLDEIGGVELLCPEFLDALLDLLHSDVPCIGVIKSDSAASRLIQTLHLEEDYRQAHMHLHTALSQIAGTHVCFFEQYDKNVLRLAKKWVEEYTNA